MARLRELHTLKLSNDTGESQQIYEKEQTNDEVTDAFVKGNSRILTVPVSSSIVVNLAGLTNVQRIRLETTKEIRLKFNGGSEELAVVPRNAITSGSVPAASLPGKFDIWTEGITNINITNPSASDVPTVVLMLAGA